jgi:hypothetical protein
MSRHADFIDYLADPIQIITGYTGDKLPSGPGAQWHLGKDMEAHFLTWPGSPPDVERMLGRVQQQIEDLLNLGSTFGREIPSGTSGSAVKSLLSGIQATFLRKQVTMGTVYRKANEVIFRIIEKYHANTQILIRGTRRGNMFVEEMKGSEIAGNYRTQIVWPPGVLDQPSRVDLEINKMNNKVQSRQTTMENIGIMSPKDELDLIRVEIEEEIAQQALKENPGAAVGIDKSKQAEFNNVSEGLQAKDFGDSGSDVSTLLQFVASIPKIRGDIHAEVKGNNVTLVLTDMKDKSTILNRLPARFKGKEKLSFREFVKGQDEELPVVIEQPEGIPPGGASASGTGSPPPQPQGATSAPR